jgi:putative chitinase
MSVTITEAQIRKLSPTAKADIIKGIVDNQATIADGGIKTPLQVCHFMAQLAHESAHFRTTREFASGAAYEGRKSLGNTERGDGVKFRGRGLIQTTGRANYKEATADIKRMTPSAPDFVANPLELEKFPWALLAGISYWRRRNINALADRDDIVRVTKRINGGTNGLADRKRYLRIAKTIWLTNDDQEDEAGSHPVLKKGDEGPDVVELQNELREAGFKVVADGDFGENTEEAVKAFQSHHGLKDDGVVGPATWGALASD